MLFRSPCRRPHRGRRAARRGAEIIPARSSQRIDPSRVRERDGQVRPRPASSRDTSPTGAWRLRCNTRSCIRAGCFRVPAEVLAWSSPGPISCALPWEEGGYRHVPRPRPCLGAKHGGEHRWKSFPPVYRRATGLLPHLADRQRLVLGCQIGLSASASNCPYPPKPAAVATSIL